MTRNDMERWLGLLWTATKVATCLAFMTACVVLIIYLPHIAGPVPRGAGGDTGLTQVEFVTIILTAVTVVVAGIGIIIALAAVVGFSEIRRSSHGVAAITAERVAREVAEPVAAREARAVAQTSASDAGDQIGRAYGDDRASS